MTRKIITAVIAIVLLGTIALFAAQKPKKGPAEKTENQAQAVTQPKQHQNLLDELIAAYKADDKEKMGEVIKKMESRREARREKQQLAGNFNKWHRRAHRRWTTRGFAPAVSGWGRHDSGPWATANWQGRRGAWANPAFRQRNAQGRNAPTRGFGPMQGWRHGAGECGKMQGYGAGPEAGWTPRFGAGIGTQGGFERGPWAGQRRQFHGWGPGPAGQRSPAQRQRPQWGFEAGQDPGPDW